MKNKFLIGAVSGISALALGVGTLAQVAGAATPATGSTASATATTGKFGGFFAKHGVPTQADVQTMIDHDTAFLANVDAMVSVAKTATQAHKDALTAAAALTDDTAREAALKKANEDFRATMKAAIDANPALKDAMPFGGHGPMGMGGKRGHGGKMMGGMLAEKLGMTPDELKAAIDSGKTIEDIAKEKGVTLPPKPMHDGRDMENDGDTDDTTTQQ